MNPLLQILWRVGQSAGPDRLATAQVGQVRSGDGYSLFIPFDPVTGDAQVLDVQERLLAAHRIATPQPRHVGGAWLDRRADWLLVLLDPALKHIRRHRDHAE